jgi:hypothetical protein
MEKEWIGRILGALHSGAFNIALNQCLCFQQDLTHKGINSLDLSGGRLENLTRWDQ